MTPVHSIYRSAKQLVDQFGAGAPIEAAIRADRMLEIGDLDGLAVWKAAVEELMSVKPGGTVH